MQFGFFKSALDEEQAGNCSQALTQACIPTTAPTAHWHTVLLNISAFAEARGKH